MVLAVQKNLFEASSETPVVDSARWIEGVMLGNLALGLCVIAVGLIGALMLTGRLPLRDGMRVVFGCFMLLGAPVIATGFAQGGSAFVNASPPPPPDFIRPEYPRPDLPPSNFDPYAGASLRED